MPHCPSTRESATRARPISRVWCASLAILAAIPAPSLSQSDTSGFHFTIRGWADDLWLQVLDRNGTAGRFSTLGILQRFHADIDAEYQLDLLSGRFTLEEDFAWYGQQSGFRWWGGSITKRDLATVAQLKHTTPLGRSWSLGIRFDREANPTTDRNFLMLRFEKAWQSGISASAFGSLDPDKSGSDLGIGVGYHNPAVRGLEAELSLATLDVASNLIYLRLKAARQGQIDSTIEYESQPLALKSSLAAPLGTAVRLEAYGMVLLPATAHQYREESETEGLSQREKLWLVGGSIEWTVVPGVVVGALGTVVQAESERHALAADLPVDEYVLTERTAQLGAISMIRFATDWRVELQMSRNWRPETRDFFDPSRTDVDYLDQAWTGQLLVMRAPTSGLLLDASLLWDARDAVRGDGQVPRAGSLGWHNYRARADVGWRAGERFMFLVGAGIDLDGDPSGKNRFGGGRGRFVVYW